MGKKRISEFIPKKYKKTIKMLFFPFLPLAQKSILKNANQKEKELEQLINLLKEKSIKNVLEIGTCLGGTLYTWCKIADDDALIISLDLPGTKYGTSPDKIDLKKMSKYKKRKQKLIFIRDDSHKKSTVNKVGDILNGKKLDFLFIDGDHEYEGAKKDFNNYSKYVKKGGLIIFHDICLCYSEKKIEVERLWNEIKHDYTYYEFIDEADRSWGGIGVIEY